MRVVAIGYGFLFAIFLKMRKAPVRRPRLDVSISKWRLGAEFLDHLPALLRVGFALIEKLFGLFGVDDRELRIASFMHDEVAEFGVIRILRSINDKRGLALFGKARVIMEAIEVTTFDRHLLFFDRVDQTAFDVLFSAGAIADDQGRSIIGFGFLEDFDRRSGVGAQSDAADVDVAIGHRHKRQVLLRFFLTGSGEFVDGTSL